MKTPQKESVFKLMFVVNIERRKNEENIYSSTYVYFVSVDYEISVPRRIPHSRRVT